MAAPNNIPIFPLTPASGWATLTAASIAKDGTGAVVLGAAAGVYGAYVDHVRFQPLGSNIASVARVFLNNGSSNAVAANNSLIGEISLPQTVLSEVVGQTTVKLPFNVSIPPGYKIYVDIATAVAAGWQATLFAGNY